MAQNKTGEAMKTLVMTLLIAMIGTIAQASMIDRSDLTAQQQQIVIDAVNNSCGYMYNYSHTAPTEVNVDYQEQGDVFYTIRLEATQRIDQGIFDIYDIEVRAVEPMVHGHAELFIVEDVRCVMR